MTTKQHGILVTGGVCSIILVFLFYLTCVHHTDLTEVGVMRNWVTGEIRYDSPGWHISAPWVKVAKIDLRPTRVCVTSASKGYNCMLVQFNREALDVFLKTEGFSYWWWANRFSFNSGHAEEYRGFRDILRGYAYSSTQYPFIRVLERY